MENQTYDLPDEQEVVRIMRQVSKEPIRTIRRFATGLCHFVYEVITESQQSFVVRIARPENRALLAGALYWHQRLKPKGMPLPEVLSADLETLTSPFPYLILERLAGEDLGFIYQQLSKSEKQGLANDIAHIQEITGTLPSGKGFGFVTSYDSAAFQDRWVDVLHNSLRRSRARIEAIGAVDSHCVDLVAEKLDKYDNYYSRVKPKCFLDDVTTKNVIVDKGTLSGIVDVDFVCFGDNLLTVALTKMSLLNSGYDFDYIDYWCAAMKITEEQRSVLQLYTAVFCVDFMSELGQAFNKTTAQPVKTENIQRLSNILNSLLNEI